jgi:hypothetical protein
MIKTELIGLDHRHADHLVGRIGLEGCQGGLELDKGPLQAFRAVVASANPHYPSRQSDKGDADLAGFLPQRTETAAAGDRRAGHPRAAGD